MLWFLTRARGDSYSLFYSIKCPKTKCFPFTIICCISEKGSGVHRQHAPDSGSNCSYVFGEVFWCTWLLWKLTCKLWSGYSSVIHLLFGWENQCFLFLWKQRNYNLKITFMSISLAYEPLIVGPMCWITLNWMIVENFPCLWAQL